MNAQILFIVCFSASLTGVGIALTIWLYHTCSDKHPEV